MKQNRMVVKKEWQEAAVASLQQWIQIDSVYDASSVTKEHPFGSGVAKALEYIACLAEKHGFEVDRCDGYCTEIAYGQGDLIAIYAHADVVPVSGEWEYGPFSGAIVDQKMVGRGTSDDKGPAMAAFYALVQLKEMGALHGFRVSLVIGGNEESGSACLDYYFHQLKKPYPKYGFTPDGDFPLIYGEKGIANYRVEQKIALEGVSYIQAGVVANSVIDCAHVRLKNSEHLRKVAKTYCLASSLKYRFEEQNEEEVLFTIYGKAAHGSRPQEGINAGLCLLRFLSIYLQEPVLEKIASSYFDGNGMKLGIYASSDFLHETSVNVGLLDYKDQILSYVVNFRYPETVNPAHVIDVLNQNSAAKHELLHASEPLLIDPKSPMVQALLDVYQTQTGDVTSTIQTIGGGTYARESKNTLAFGSHFPGREDHIHDANESIHLEDFISSIAIYAAAVVRLGNL